jgi:murein DD-endopeptidase MepM/ murein hydrolase activator NlpD
MFPLLRTLSRLFRPQAGRRPARPRPTVRPAVESLEERALLSRTLTVPIPPVYYVANPLYDSTGEVTHRKVFPQNPAGQQVQGDGSCGGRGGRHAGTDLVATLGTPVHAVADGEVIAVRSDWRPPAHPNRNSAPGNFVYIRHTTPDGQTYVSSYFHLMSGAFGRLAGTPPPHVGQHVSAGQVIGFVGRTGNVVPHGDAHLHFELHAGSAANGPTFCALILPGADVIPTPPYSDGPGGASHHGWQLFGRQCYDPIYFSPDFCNTYGPEQQLPDPANPNQDDFPDQASMERAAQSWHDHGFTITRRVPPG